jgi:hypothetical protein
MFRTRTHADVFCASASARSRLGHGEHRTGRTYPLDHPGKLAGGMIVLPGALPLPAGWGRKSHWTTDCTVAWLHFPQTARVGPPKRKPSNLDVHSTKHLSTRLLPSGNRAIGEPIHLPRAFGANAARRRIGQLMSCSQSPHGHAHRSGAIPGREAAQFSSSASSGATTASATGDILDFSRITASMRAAMAGEFSRNSLAFSRPWPRRVSS